MSLDKHTGYRGLPTTLALSCLASAVACASGGQPPQLMGLSDQVAQVGVALRIELDATNTQGGKLAYTYHNSDLSDLAGAASISVAPSGAGEFTWTPLAADIGSHAFDFIVSDGHSSSTTTINIDVKAVIGGGPQFRQPLGTGTTIDVTHQMCVDLDVVIDDQAAAMVKLAQEQPTIDGAMLTPVDGQSAKWHWCPSATQKSESRYTLVLSADDGTNPKVLKDYLIVLRGGTAACPGSGPTIDHTAMDQTTRLDLALAANIADTLGLKDTPLLYYSTTNPGANPDVSTMTQVSATLTTGTTMSGTFTATVPNPVATMADGSSATLYYVFAADDFDQTNNCNHVTQSQVYMMNVTAGGTKTAGLCASCTADAQCGAGNECVVMGDLGNSYCTQSCGGGCPSGYSCSVSAITSVGGASAMQCIPQSGSCEMPAGQCENDIWDPNQTMSEASANGNIPLGFNGSLVSCPDPNSSTRGETDWFRIQLPSAGLLVTTLSGDGSVDLDLHIYDSSGTFIDHSAGPTDQESMSDCLLDHVYYIKVDSFGYARDVYSLDIELTPGGC